MADSPFNEIPKQAFITRMVIPSVFLFSLGWMSVGVLSSMPTFKDHRAPAAVLPFWEASLKLDQDILSTLKQIPSVCWSGNAVNEFQKHQCDEFWDDLAKSGALAASPIVLVLLFLWMGLNNLTSVYRKAHKKITQGKVAFGGVVTNPPAGPRNLFSWFYCLRPITIELPNKNQVTVYVSILEPRPNPGDTLVAVEVGNVLGAKRQLAILYAPHVAVVRGT